MSEKSEKTNIDNDDVVVVVKKAKNPALRWVLGSILGFAFLSLSLFTLGLFLGSSGYKPPHIEPAFFENYWNKISGNVAENTFNEVELDVTKINYINHVR